MDLIGKIIARFDDSLDDDKKALIVKRFDFSFHLGSKKYYCKSYVVPTPGKTIIRIDIEKEKSDVKA